MKHIVCWKAYYMTTNSKDDVWIQTDYLNSKIPLNLVGKPKMRLIIPIRLLKILNSGEKLYLVCQYNSNPKWGLIPIPQSLVAQDSNIHGYVSSINIRIASETEFQNYKKPLVVDKKERKEYLRKVMNQLQFNPWLSWRHQTIQNVINGKYDNHDSKSILKLICYNQFNKIELKQSK